MSRKGLRILQISRLSNTIIEATASVGERENNDHRCRGFYFCFKKMLARGDRISQESTGLQVASSFLHREREVRRQTSLLVPACVARLLQKLLLQMMIRFQRCSLKEHLDESKEES